MTRLPGGSHHKYNARKTTIDGYTFDSLAEGRRYQQLKLAVKSGDISNLIIQPEFVLQDGFTDNQGKRQQAIKYRGDFEYLDKNTNELVIEDVKGKKTQVFLIKKKMFLKRYPNLALRVVPISEI